MFEWRQEGNRVFLKEPKGEIYFIVPEDFKLEDTSQELLRLVEYTLFSPHYKDEFKKSKLAKLKWKRKPGTKIGHSFSTGLDSTAALLLLPEDTVIYYHNRSEYLGGQMNQDNAIRMIKQMDREVQVIPSNHEMVNMFHGKVRGSFSTDFACCASLILLADYYNLGYISTGTMLGSTYVRKGWAYQEFEKSEYWTRWHSLFKKAGLGLMFPVGGASEVITNDMVKMSHYNKLAHSCIRGRAGRDCNICYKCFRKNLLNGKSYHIMAEETAHHLEARPLKQGDSMIYAYQYSKLDIPQLKEYKKVDVTWLRRFYEKSLELVPEEFRKEIKEKLKEYGVEFMDAQDIKTMKEFDIK